MNQYTQLARELQVSVSDVLLDWYRLNKRDLPWRDTCDPYKIWVSEIILQQTRVDQGLNYYIRFTERFPDVQTLSSVDEEEVLKYWQGLGYYSRARNLHFTAKVIAKNFNGNFPRNYNILLELKGIGEYTAAAIASFAWNLPHPVVDGNVFRFLSRLLSIDTAINTGKGKKIFTEIASLLIDKRQPGLFNQAIMEFGALQCTPILPACEQCPFAPHCIAYSTSSTDLYPVKEGKTKIQTRYLYYFHILYQGYTFIQKRVKKGIWQHLYEFPMIESGNELTLEQLLSEEELSHIFPSTLKAHFRLVVKKKKHILSHRILYADFFEVQLDELPDSLAIFTKIVSKEIDNYPTHRLMHSYLEEHTT